MRLPFTFWLLMGILSPIWGGEIPLQSFEDGTTQGWVLNSEGWAGGFSAVENSTANATEGSHSLRIRFAGEFRRWGAYRTNLNDSVALWAMRFGGTLLVDVTVPSASAAVQEIGLSFQQPDVLGAAGWQEVWFPIGHAGVFTIALPVNRVGAAPPNLNLGQSAPGGNNFEVFVDRVRFAPNPPPVKGFVLPREIPVAGFEAGTDGFQAVGAATINSQEGHATEGARSLAVNFDKGSRTMVAARSGIGDPGILSEIAKSGTMLVDVIVPAGTGAMELIAGFYQPDGPGADEKYLSVPGAGTYTIAIPFKRVGFGPVDIRFGRSALNAGTIYFDRVRFRIDEVVGGYPGTLAMDRAIHYSGALESSASISGPFAQIAAGGDFVEVDYGQPKQFFRARDWAGILFTDDFEGNHAWSGQGIWRRVDGIGRGGGHAWGTANDFVSGYPAATTASLLSPPISLPSGAGAMLSFYQVLDISGEFEFDTAEIYLRAENGDPLPGAPNAIFQEAQRSYGLAWERREVNLPAGAIGQTVRHEFRFTSDGFGFENPPQSGWFLDDVRVALKP